MVYFEKVTVQYLQNLRFHTKLLGFVFGCTPSFDMKISGMKTNVDKTPSDTR